MKTKVSIIAVFTIFISFVQLAIPQAQVSAKEASIQNQYWVTPAYGVGCGAVSITHNQGIDAWYDDNGEIRRQCGHMGVFGTKRWGDHIAVYVSLPMSNLENELQVVLVGPGTDWMWEGAPAPSNLWVTPTVYAGCGRVYKTLDAVTFYPLLDSNGEHARQCGQMGVLGPMAGTPLGDIAFVSFPDQYGWLQIIVLDAPGVPASQEDWRWLVQ